jgi:VCBS repeat-containing protein
MSQILFDGHFKKESIVICIKRTLLAVALSFMFLIVATMLGISVSAAAETAASPVAINQPAILGSASVVLTESNESLSTSGTLSIRDADSPETFVARRNVKGKYGTFNIDKSGAWSYATKGALDKLGEGQSVSDSFPVSSADGTKTSVQITINGTNDPAVLGAPNVSLKEINEPLKASGNVSIRDVDSPETFVEQNDVKGKNGTFSIDSRGAWTFVANSAFDELSEGQSVSDSFPVSSTDGTKTTVQVTINGTNDPAVLDAPSVSLQETNEPLKASGKVSIRDPDSPENFVEQSNVKGKTGSFSIDNAGNWTYVADSALDELSEGKSVSDNFPVSSTDGTKTSVKITIKGTNDAAILSTAAVSLDETNAPLTATGTLTISDVDSPETFKANKRISGAYGSLSIDSKGRWKYVTNSALDELKEGQIVTDSFTVASSDGTNTTVEVTINGTNDPAILKSPSVSLKETNEPLNVSGKVSIRDVDSPETFVTQKNVKGTNGTFSIEADGTWTYVANSAFDEMKVGQSVSDSFTVTSSDGTQSKVQVTINGTNDPAVLGSAALVLDETNEPLNPTGKLTIRDVDSPETFVAQSNVKGKYGTFSIDSAGSWTYVANSAFDKLNVGQSVSDNFTVSSADGTKSKVQITINGSNDAAILSSATIALEETNIPLSASGKLTIRDVDSPEKFVEQINTRGTYGTFNIDNSGRWKYVANSGFDELNIGQSYSDSFTVSSDDGTNTTVQVTINGTNDAAVLGIGYEVLTETNETLRTGGTLSIRDVDNPATFVAQDNVKGKTGTFSIDTSGRWTYVSDGALDWISEGRTASDIFTVSSSDGTKTTVQVTINGTNDAAILSSATLVLDETNEPLKPTGKLSIQDVDSPETFVAQSNVKGKNGTFSIDTSGQWTYVANSAFDEMNVGQSVSDSFTVSSSDGTTTSVQVTINGTNDPAVMGPLKVSLTETDEALRVTGKVNIRDVDSPATIGAQLHVKGKNGTFSIESDGAWTYTAKSAFDWLGVDQSVSDYFKVTSADGTVAWVKVEISGSNDPASLSAPNVTLKETNSPRRAGGWIQIVDVDSPMTVVPQSNVVGENGTFNIDASGRWTYVANSAFDELKEGQSVSDKFTVISKDGTTTSVNITIEGREESRYDGTWFSGRIGINRSSLNGLDARDASFYGIEEGATWKVGVLQLGVYGSLEFNNTASGPINYSSNIISLGAKLGIPAGKWQPYGKLGLARTNGNDGAELIGAGHVYTALGIEYKMAENWGIAGEYSRSNGDTVGVPTPIPELVKKPAKGAPPKPQSVEEPALELPTEPAPATEPAITPAFGPAPAAETEPAITPAFGPVPAPVPKSEPAPEPEPAFTPSFVPVPAPATKSEPAPAPKSDPEPAFAPAFSPPSDPAQ